MGVCWHAHLLAEGQSGKSCLISFFFSHPTLKNGYPLHLTASRIASVILKGGDLIDWDIRRAVKIPRISAQEKLAKLSEHVEILNATVNDLMNGDLNSLSSSESNSDRSPKRQKSNEDD